MRNIIVSVVIILILLGAGLFITKNNQSLISTNIISPAITPSVSPVPTEAETEDSTKASTNSYNVDWIIVRDPKKITLHSNSEEKLTSMEAMEKYECAELINGGFWREDTGEPMGLFVSDGKKVHDTINSSLLNGYFNIENSLDFSITQNPLSIENLSLSLQSGPILFADSKPVKVEGNDEKARRVVVALTKKGEIVFMVFYYKPSPMTGPKLADLPSLLEDLYNTSNLKVDSALNLDGGAHSAFITDTVKITEVARIGSFFCIKP